MATPTEPSEDAYRRLADLAEGLVDQISSLKPDWCAVAQAATELAQAARRRCNGTSPTSG